VHIGRLSVIAGHDTRDNIFSPTSGHFVEAELAVARPELGGTTSYEQANLRGFDWLSLATVTATGVGFRYLMAKALGIHAGIDIARGPEGTTFYIQVCSAWR